MSTSQFFPVVTKNKSYFVDDQNHKQGKCVILHDDGTVAIEAHYKDNVLHGQYKFWYQNTRLCVVEQYDNGVRVSDYHYYKDN